MGNPLVVLDSNVIISSLLYSPGSASRIIKLWRNNFFQILISSYILSEIKDALRDKQLIQKYHISPIKRDRLLTQLHHAGERLDPVGSYGLASRDPKDSPIIQLALVGHADYLVTGDQDLLVLANNASVKPLAILNPHDFLQKFLSSDKLVEEYLASRGKS